MLEFRSGWNREIDAYRNHYGPYQAYLDSFSEGDIAQAITNYSAGDDLQELVEAALSDDAIVYIEQGAHQAEPIINGQPLSSYDRDWQNYYKQQLANGTLESDPGFTLHVTARFQGANDRRAFAYHLYLQQEGSGKPYIWGWTA